MSHLGGLRRKGATEDELFTAADEFNEAHCDPPLDNSEVQSVVKSAAKYEPQFEDGADAVAELNKRYAIVQLSGKVRVLQEDAESIVLMARGVSFPLLQSVCAR